MRSQDSDLEFITTIESGTTRCHWVRIGQKQSWGVSKSFPYARYGSKEEALVAAKQWRDLQVKQQKNLILSERYWGKQWVEVWKEKSSGWSYLYIVAKIWCNKEKKQFERAFSANKYGYEGAIELAVEWIEKQKKLRPRLKVPA